MKQSHFKFTDAVYVPCFMPRIFSMNKSAQFLRLIRFIVYLNGWSISMELITIITNTIWLLLFFVGSMFIVIRICIYTFWRLVYRSAYVIYCDAFKCKLRTLISYIAYALYLVAIRMRTKQFVYLHEFMRTIVHL